MCVCPIVYGNTPLANGDLKTEQKKGESHGSHVTPVRYHMEIM